MGLKSVEGENSDAASNVPKCLQAEGLLVARHRTSKNASALVAKEDRLARLLTVWPPARCPEMMDFGNGNEILNIRAPKYTGKNGV